MRLKKQKGIGNLIKVVMFLAILFMVFVCLTYLFRNTERTAREIIVEYYEEEENTLDVVYIGASNVIRYWDPMRAWNEYGFTSRNVATMPMNGGTYLYAIKSALKTQKPEVVMVDTRMLISEFKDTEIPAGVRNFFDSLDVGMFRFEAIKYYCDVFDVSFEDSLSLYLDLIQYHDNYAALIEPKHWKLADNRLGEVSDYQNVYKGFGLKGEHVVVKNPSENISDECIEPTEIAVRLYMDIIEYCEANDINVMFVASPMVVSKKEEKKLNWLAQVAAEYDIDFIDGNKLYDEMGIDFTKDFYNDDHTNVLGSHKFTDYLSAYLVENYDLPDHRGEAEYDSWNELYEKYSVDEKKERARALASIEVNEKAFEAEKGMKETNNPLEWLLLADNSEITVFMVGNKVSEMSLSVDSELALNMYGVNVDLAKNDCFTVIYNNAVKYCDYNTGKKKGKVGNAEIGQIEYLLEVGDKMKLCLGDENYHDSAKGAIHAVAIDNNTNEIVDAIHLSVVADGSLSMMR